MLTATIDRYGAGRVAVRLQGDLDMATSDQVMHAFTEAMAEPPVSLIMFDLAKLNFLDSCGLRALIQAHKLATGAGAEFQLYRPQPIVARVLQIVGVNELLGVTEEAGPGAPEPGLA